MKQTQRSTEQRLAILEHQNQALQQELQEIRQKEQRKRLFSRKRLRYMLPLLSFTLLLAAVWLAHAQQDVLTYSGYLEEKGEPVSGKRRVILSLWDHQTPITGKTPVCSMNLSATNNSEVLFVKGRFKIALSSACVTEVSKASKPLWVQLQVYREDGKTSQTLARARIGSVPQAMHGVPPGTVVAFAGVKADIPAGWELCDGRKLTKTQDGGKYVRLFEAIKYAHGKSSNPDEFYLPDYRGIFLRGVDQGVGRDPDRNSRIAPNNGNSFGDRVGSIQPDATKRPNNRFSTSTNGTHSHSVVAALRDDIGQRANITNGYTSLPANRSTTAITSQEGAHQHIVESGGDKETRPKNAYVNFIIKY